MLTREDIINMALKAGAADYGCTIAISHDALLDVMNTAYAAGQAAEREACAKVCDEIEVERYALFKGRPPYTGREEGRADHYVNGESDGAGRCAAAIRARNNQGNQHEN